MDRLQNRRDNIRERIRRRWEVDHELMDTYPIKKDLTRESTDEIEKALWDIKDAMDIPTEEIELAVESRRQLK